MNVLIVDDEAPARVRLRQILDDANQHVVVGEAANGQEALKLAGTTQPDVVLLDIRMPGLDGIETAHHMNKLDHPPAIVFTTAYDEYAIDAFEANAIGYVLKPVRRERLDQALKLAARLNNDTLRHIGVDGAEPRKHVCCKVQGELRLIPIDDVWCFLADQKYVAVVHKAGRNLIDDSLKSLEEEFSDRFVRIHRGALVSLSSVHSLRKTGDGHTQVMLREQIDEDELIVSRRHVANVKRRLTKG